jgi:ribosomal protein L11 methyltransferase
MGYYEFIVDVSDTSRDALINRLSEMGCLGVTEYGKQIKAYFKDSLDIIMLRDGLKSFRNVLEKAGLDHDFSFDYLYLSERDWNESWKKKFVPIDVGETLSILPPWENAVRGRIPLIIDPGMAFGTGHHETTKTCLTLIERISKTPRRGRFLDVGTGTGILAIAASRLGFCHVVGIDVDPLAVDAAQRNVQTNGLEHVEIRECTLSDVEGTFDGIAANLMSEILIHIAPEIASRLDREGIVILSGMLVGQEGVVREAMNASGLVCSEEIIDGRWVSLVLTKSLSG